MARKLKMPWGVFVDHFEYYASQRRADLFDMGPGVLYWLDTAPTPEQKAVAAKYSNVRLFSGHAEYAPEIKRYYLYIADKCFKGV